MPLILAVEPDRRQASHIVAVLRGRPRTELIIAESAAAAVQAIAARVPDLLLTSPLLSRQDEARLAEWLGGLGPAAAHVQALTIPILETAAPETTRGMLSMLRRRRPRTPSPTGCEPAMFASQVGLYLERASVDRENKSAATVPPEPPPALALEWLAEAIERDSEPAIAQIDPAVSNRIEAEIDLTSLGADEESLWVAGPLDDVREEPEPASAEPVADDGWMLTPGPEVDELVAAAPPDAPDTAQVILLTPIYDLPPEPVVNRIEAEIDLTSPGADEESLWVAGPLDEVPEDPAHMPQPASAEPVADDAWMLTPGPEVDELAAAAPQDAPGTATFMLLTPIYDLPPEPVVNRIEAEIAMASLADQESLWVAGPLDDVREEPEPASAELVTDDGWMLTPCPEVDELVAAAPPDAPGAATFMLLTPIYDLPPEPVVEASVFAPAAEAEAAAPEAVTAALQVVAATAIEPYREPATAEIDIAMSRRIEAAMALAALRAHEEAQWLAVPIEDLGEAPVAMPERAPAEPVTVDMRMLTLAPEVEELVASVPADSPDTAATILLTAIYNPPLQPVEAVVAAPIRKVVKTPSPATTRRRKVEKPRKRPAQDEWGFFDPDQCGFAALLDKLDEITAQEMAGGKPRDDVDVRVISY